MRLFLIYLKSDIRFNKGLNVPSFNVFSEGLYPVTEKIKRNPSLTEAGGHLNLVIKTYITGGSALWQVATEPTGFQRKYGVN